MEGQVILNHARWREVQELHDWARIKKLGGAAWVCKEAWRKGGGFSPLYGWGLTEEKNENNASLGTGGR